ncbi:MAG: hypothetical protein COU10_02730 [Candidatus Harrisonbacteria bacterium CG10_big_fil_rev_8_21_14_0_10_45_28]|uniref:Uncharacterized protein n=1 Tax=Candidatus Harrisonbacteria bacterium CG10_big_fil_rev_8_21_14_0_10_45_28 TaxID=1974586 RepID=A0A2H0UMZ4_9BACT|nr:MAG: hypothetical protein COU10_02730 [Candidatus Harrisonbacteria bacterium CG10_big_fil_rev_8_21_14_0_10_45_28]
MIPPSPKDIFNHITGRQGFDYDQIEESVFIGTNMCYQYRISKKQTSFDSFERSSDKITC